MKNCLRDRHHSLQDRPGLIRYIDAPHGDITCKICSLSFKFQEHHARHVEIEHLLQRAS